jgi:hypothetical protein
MEKEFIVGVVALEATQVNEQSLEEGRWCIDTRFDVVNGAGKRDSCSG